MRSLARRFRSGALSHSPGFSLLEILVVIAIMAVLATLVAPRLLAQLDRSKVTAARTQIQTLATQLDTVRLDLGRYPTTEEGLAILVTAPSDEKLKAKWNGPYIKGGVPMDPWGNAYVYVGPLTRDGLPTIRSLGPDGVEGGGDDENLTS